MALAPRGKAHDHHRAVRNVGHDRNAVAMHRSIFVPPTCITRHFCPFALAKKAPASNGHERNVITTHADARRPPIETTVAREMI